MLLMYLFSGFELLISHAGVAVFVLSRLFNDAADLFTK